MAFYIFDFDGTLADSFHAFSKILLENAKELGCKQLEINEINNLKSMHAKDVIKYLEISFWKIPEFINKLRKLNSKKTEEIEIFPGWPEVLTILKKNQHGIGILSSNSENTIKEILRKNNLNEAFDFIVSEKAILGKKRALKKLIKTLKLDKKTTYYIGDEVRDIEAAKAAQIHSIAVSWGFNSISRLKSAEPDLLIKSPQELL